MCKEFEKDICPLYYGDSCPVCDDEWVDLGISYEEGQAINEECCATHCHPDHDELKQTYGDF